jgi:hypothetical protein
MNPLRTTPKDYEPISQLSPDSPCGGNEQQQQNTTTLLSTTSGTTIVTRTPATSATVPFSISPVYKSEPVHLNPTVVYAANTLLRLRESKLNLF